MTFSVNTAMKLYLKLTFFAGFLCCALHSRAQVSYDAFHNQTDLNVKSEMGLELWNYYLRFNLDSFNALNLAGIPRPGSDGIIRRTAQHVMQCSWMGNATISGA